MKWRQKVSDAISIRGLSVVAAIVLLGPAHVYGAGISSPKTRISMAGDKFDGVTQIAAAFEISDWSLLRAHHIEIAVGSISSASGNAAFVSIGPVWRSPLVNDRFFADVGVAPTLISASRYGGRDLGGHFHFTSSVSAGMRFGRFGSLLLRIQHTSNGGLRGANPGMDMLGLEFSFSFSE